jgi:2-keto-4-pentenoate hydratase
LDRFTDQCRFRADERTRPVATVAGTSHASFEVVHSIFPNWTFTAADAVAAYGVHGALLIGDRHPISGHRSRWAKALSNFSVELLQGDGVRVRGHARDVLGGPVQALRFLIQELARYSARDPLAPGEIVTTGTLTEAMPAIPGDTWNTVLSGIEIEGLRLQFR